MKKSICHVCGKIKKPYMVFLDSDVLSIIKYQNAREKGEICQRCDQYYAMTGKFKDATKEEFEIAKKSVWFANMVQKWWEKEQELEFDLIAICCDYSELTIEELKTDYSEDYDAILEVVDESVYDGEEEKNNDILNCFIERLGQETTILEVEENKRYIVQNF